MTGDCQVHVDRAPFTLFGRWVVYSEALGGYTFADLQLPEDSPPQVPIPDPLPEKSERLCKVRKNGRRRAEIRNGNGNRKARRLAALGY